MNSTAQQLEEQGYAVVPGVLTGAECDAWCAAVDDAWRRQLGMPIDHTPTRDVRFVDNLLRFSPMFEKCVADPRVVAAARSVLGDDMRFFLINGRCADPGGGDQPLHDLRRRRGRPFARCNTIWCLDEFTADNGATRVIPGSHLGDTEFRVDDPFAPHPDERLVVAPRGSVILFNAALVHGGTRNRTEAPRRSVQSTFCLASERPHQDWHALPGAVTARLGPRSRDLLGLLPAALTA